MRTTKQAFVAAGLVGFLGITQALASRPYSYTYVADADNYGYEVPVNGTVTVPLYLQETGYSSSSLLADEFGLLSAGLSVASDPLSTATVPATITNITGNAGTPPAGFDLLVQATHDAASGSISESADILGIEGVGGPRVFLGNVEIHGGSIPGEITSFTVGALISGGAGSTFTFTNLYDLDTGDGSAGGYTNTAGSTFTVTTVPEPAVLAVGALASLLTLVRRRARR